MFHDSTARFAVNDEDHEEPMTSSFEPGSSLQKSDELDHLKKGNSPGKDVIDILKATIEELEQSLSSKFSRETDDVQRTEFASANISQSAQDFIIKFRFLVDCIENRLNVSPMQQQEKNRELRRTDRSRRQTEAEIKSLNGTLEAERAEHRKSMKNLEEKLEMCRKMIDEKSREIKNEINRIENESEKEMTKHYKESVAKQKMLNCEIEILQKRFKETRKNDIEKENKLRSERRNVENELLNTLKKYDTDIKSRYEEMINLSEQYQQLNQEKEILENDVMIELRKLHDDLQQEKAEALLKILNEKLEKFVRNRAARIIQKAWRAYWERHCAKKKKKSRRK